MELRIEIDERTAQLIQDRVASGRNTDAADVVREALRLLDDADRTRRELHAALKTGFDELERGEGIPWSPTFLSEMYDEIVRKDENDRRTRERSIAE